MIIQSFILFTDRPYTDEDDNLFVRGQPVCDDWWSIHDGHVVCRSGQFFPKKFNFGQFSTSESEKYGEIFLAKYSPMRLAIIHTKQDAIFL